MALTIRRQIERAEGLGPRTQEEMLAILRALYPKLEVKLKVDPWDDESVLYFSATGLKIKEDELHQIVNVKMRENAKAIGEAAAHGDLSENSEYKFALEERDLLRARVAQINSELSIARVLEPHMVPFDQVGIGHRLTLQPTDGGDPVIMSILGINDTDLPAKSYSYKTPIARQVLGRRVGDVLHVSFGDHEGDYRIEKLDPAIT
jgi:transcription elongation GreA/GreB family factor